MHSRLTALATCGTATEICNANKFVMALQESVYALNDDAKTQ